MKLEVHANPSKGLRQPSSGADALAGVPASSIVTHRNTPLVASSWLCGDIREWIRGVARSILPARSRERLTDPGPRRRGDRFEDVLAVRRNGSAPAFLLC